VLGASGRTVEDLVVEALRPMLREWLDANLPKITERLVKREIARIDRRAEEE
jgi:cell pole-organizing protein PopZ